MFYRAFFTLFVCYQLQVKTTDQIFVKILPEMYLWTRKNWLNFGSLQPLYPDLGIVAGFFSIARQSIFPQFGSCVWRKNWSSPHSCMLDKAVPIELSALVGTVIEIDSNLSKSSMTSRCEFWTRCIDELGTSVSYQELNHFKGTVPYMTSTAERSSAIWVCFFSFVERLSGLKLNPIWTRINSASPLERI